MDRIRVGLSATLTGRYSLQGIESFNGFKLWADNVNSSGGIKLDNPERNLPVDFHFYDDESDPKKTEEITRKLILEDKVDILIGPYSSSLSVAAAGISEQLNRVLWNYGGSTDVLSESRYKKVISSITPAGRYFHPFINLIIEMNQNTGAHPPTVAIVFALDSGFSNEAAKGAMNHCDKLGIEYNVHNYNSGNRDFREIVEKIGSENTRYVMGVGRFEDDVNFAKVLKGFNTCLVAAGIDEFKNLLNLESEGVFSVTQWEPEAEYRTDFGLSSKEFTELYSIKYGKRPDYTSAQSFNMGIILEYLICETGSFDDEILKNKIEDLKFCTFYGNFEIEPGSNLQTGHKTLVTQWQKGKREIIYPLEQQTSQISLI